MSHIATGFYKKAEEMGYSKIAVDSFIAQIDAITKAAQDYIEEAAQASGNPVMFKQALVRELLEKNAEGPPPEVDPNAAAQAGAVSGAGAGKAGPQGAGFLENLLKNPMVAELWNHLKAGGMGGAGIGLGAGGLLGLVLSLLTGSNPMTGMLAGGGLGASVGYAGGPAYEAYKASQKAQGAPKTPGADTAAATPGQAAPETNPNGAAQLPQAAEAGASPEQAQTGGPSGNPSQSLGVLKEQHGDPSQSLGVMQSDEDPFFKANQQGMQDSTLGQPPVLTPAQKPSALDTPLPQPAGMADQWNAISGTRATGQAGTPNNTSMPRGPSGTMNMGDGKGDVNPDVGNIDLGNTQAKLGPQASNGTPQAGMAAKPMAAPLPPPVTPAAKPTTAVASAGGKPGSPGGIFDMGKANKMDTLGSKPQLPVA